MLLNGGVDLRVSPQLKVVTNVSYLQFADATVLQQLMALQRRPGFEDNAIGWDVGAGAKLRPFVNENLFFVVGFSTLVPHGGFATALGSRTAVCFICRRDPAGLFEATIQSYDESKRHPLSFYGPLAALAAVWLVCAIVSAAPPSDAPVAPKAQPLAAVNAAHPHAMGAQATQVPAGRTESAPSTGCMGCHTNATDPHPTKQNLTCVDCHGGDGAATSKEKAHPKPRYPDQWPSAANPHETYTLLNHERHEWIRFVNPSDLRVAPEVCGRCHGPIVRSVQKGPMTNSAQVYSTALYNNASVPFKDALFAENYTPRGEPQIIRTLPPPTAEETRTKGILPVLFPFPAIRDRTARQHLPRLRARRRPQVRARQSQPRGRAGPAGRHRQQSRIRHAGIGRSRDPRRAENASERSGDVVPRHERFARRLPEERLRVVPRRSTRTIAIRSIPDRTRSSGTAVSA